jgi:Rieske [2Fe-2S] domain
MQQTYAVPQPRRHFAFAREKAYVDVTSSERVITGGVLMDALNQESALAGSLEELNAKGRLVVHGSHRPILVLYDRGRVFALDNRCPHMGFPLERGSVEDAF